MGKKEKVKLVDGYVEDIITHFNYGDLIRIEYLERLFGVEKVELEFGARMGRLKNELIEYGCILSLVLGEGYKILHPREVPLEVYRKYGLVSLNRLRKGLKIMDCTDQSLLTDEEKEQFVSFEKVLATVLKDSENNLLNAQALISDVKRKELNQ